MKTEPLYRLYARFKREAHERLGIDSRTLAAFRVALAAVVLVDLALRSRSLAALYTDEGVLPTSVIVEHFSTLIRYAPHTLGGSVEFEAFLFALTAAFAVALVVGYRTRTATAVVFLLVASLHLRNPTVLNSGDILLTRILFWSVFLPLGEVWSVDAFRHPDGARDRIASVATAGILAQVTIVYAVNGVFKMRSEEWLSGEAVPTVFELTAYTTQFGRFLAQYPDLLVFLNYLWVAMLVASPLLLVFRGWLRAAFAGMFVAAQAGLLVTMTIAVFPLVSIAGLVAFTPSVLWDALSRLRRRLGDRWGAETTSSVLSRPSQSRKRRSGSDPRRHDAVPDIVTGLDPDGVPSLGRLGSLAASVSLAVLLLTVLVMNASAVGYIDTSEAPEPVEEHIKYKWSLFAPDPVSSDRWYVARGKTDSGGEVDPLHRSSAFTFDRRPDPFPSARWRKYLDSVKDRDAEYLDEPLGEYLCARWDSKGESRLTQLKLYYVWVGNSGEMNEKEVMSHSCDGGVRT